MGRVLHSWNIFDLLVISGSVFTMFVSGPGLAILRLVRVFRVLRVIKRLYALRRIINALTKSMIPMVNAFTVLFLVASIYSTLAVILFGEKSPVLFGSFSAAFFTVFASASLSCLFQHNPRAKLVGVPCKSDW